LEWNNPACCTSHEGKAKPSCALDFVGGSRCVDYARSVADLDFEELVEEFYMPLYRFALSLSRHESDAADLTQQTFFLWASKGHQLRDASKVKTWLFTSLYREFLGRKRQQNRVVEAEDSGQAIAARSVPASVVNQLDGEIVQRALFALEEIYRAPLTLFYLQEHSYKEIAETLEVPIGTVMSRISRGKEQLRKALADSAGLATNQTTGQRHG
jgi:RNA polymerase sigma-70 factor (ECF subfamily)